MDNLHSTTLLPDVLKSLLLELVYQYPTGKQPIVQVTKDRNFKPGYTLGPLVTVVLSNEYEITALLGNHRFYLSPVNTTVQGERRKLLNEDRKRWSVATTGYDVQVPFMHAVWALQGSTLYIGKIDERSIRMLDGSELTFGSKREFLSRIFYDGFKRACDNALREQQLSDTTKHFATFYSELSRQSLARVQTEIEDNESHLRDLSRQYNQTLAKLAKQREEKLLFKLAINTKCARTITNVERIAKQLQQLAGDRFSSISISDSELTATHTNIQIEDPDSNEISELGDINCLIELTGKELIRFEPAGNNEHRGSYFHPHINEMGSPCLGNIGDDVNKLLAQREFGTLLLLLDEFLMSYNPADPYVNWFDPEEDEYTRCYESGDATCIDCRDSDCTYYPERWERCYDNSNSSECLDCANPECPYLDDVRDECRNDGSPYECLQCTRTWCLLKPEDEDDCRKRNEFECEGCENREECIAWEGEDEAIETDENGVDTQAEVDG